MIVDLCNSDLCYSKGIFMVLITVAIKIKIATFYVPDTMLMDSCACSFPPDLSYKRYREMPSSWASELLFVSHGFKGRGGIQTSTS